MAAVLKPFFNQDIIGTKTIVKADSGKVFFVSSEIQATNILTLTTGQNANEGGTVTINGKVYTFNATLGSSDGNVHIGADNTGSLANLIDAINLGPGVGTDYATATTLNPDVAASVQGTDGMLVRAKRAGPSGNSITVSETLTQGAWADPNKLANGKDTPSDGNREFIITLPQDDVDGGNYEFVFRDNGRSKDSSNRDFFTSWTISSGLTKPFRVTNGTRGGNPYNSRSLLTTKGATLEGVKLGGRINDGPGGTVLNYPAGEKIEFVSWGGVWYSTAPFGSGFYGIGDF